MNTYEVTASWLTSVIVTVRAENEKDARQTAMIMIDRHDYDPLDEGFSDFAVDDIDLVSEVE